MFNVGDSRVYREADGALARATVDHSEAEELLLEGVITAEQARTHRARNIVTRSLGQPDAPQVDLWLLPQTPGERFLICSDGLNGELTDDAIHALLAAHPDPGQAAASLVAAALEGGGRDNVTAIVLNVEGAASDPRQHQPAPHGGARMTTWPFSYSPGTLVGFATADLVALVDLPTDDELVARIATVVAGEAPTLDAVLDILVSRGLRSVDTFGLAARSPDAACVCSSAAPAARWPTTTARRAPRACGPRASGKG